jgi:hypothetical protein
MLVLKQADSKSEHHPSTLLDLAKLIELPLAVPPNFSERQFFSWEIYNISSTDIAYYQAEAACPTDPVYPSNLSAALYELGNYHETVETISRSWNLIPPSSSSSLLAKLSSRMVKSLCHGTRSGTITSDTTDKYKAVINALESVAISEASSEVCGFWKEWRKMEGEEGDRKQAAYEALKRLSRIPKFRQPLCVQDFSVTLLFPNGLMGLQQHPRRVFHGRSPSCVHLYLLQ